MAVVLKNVEQKFYFPKLVCQIFRVITVNMLQNTVRTGKGNIYRIRPNFRGAQFSQIAFSKHFVELFSRIKSFEYRVL